MNETPLHLPSHLLHHHAGAVSNVPSLLDPAQYTPGPRQTVDRCCHPTLGEGIVAYDNGPAWFRADTGEIVAPIRLIGHSVRTADSTTTIMVCIADGKRTQLDTTGRQRGESHRRIIADGLGPGWLVVPADSGNPLRFEADSGTMMELAWSAMWVGKPGDASRDGFTPRASIPRSHEAYRTIQLRSGETFVYLPDVGARPTGATKQMELTT